jgi:hypothetical protein
MEKEESKKLLNELNNLIIEEKLDEIDELKDIAKKIDEYANKDSD